MKIAKEIQIVVCEDCANYIANGEQPAHYDLERDPNWKEEEDENHHWEFNLSFDHNDHREHSIQPCDHCGNKFHGTRWGGTALLYEKE